jgi:phosphoserine phosphatase RsbU/P
VFAEKLSVVLGSAGVYEATSRLRWELTAIVIGVAILTFGLAGLTLFVFRRKTGDRSLLYFSLFSFLYAIRLIFRQRLIHTAIPVSQAFWNYSDLLIDNFIVLPLTLFLIEVVEARWKRFMRWVLAFQAAFASMRFALQVAHAGERPRELAYHVAIVAYCTLLFIYPIVLAWRKEKLAQEFKVAYAGLGVFAAFVIYNNLIDLHLIQGLSLEAIGFVVFLGCLGYVAASRTYANEQRLLSIQKELEIARQIQSAILPREVPRVAGLDIAAQYLPMTAVAGDFYDFVAVDERRVGILVADVTGHGVPAALIASMLKSALGAQSGHANEPAQVLSGLNRALCGKFEEHFVTAAYLFVDAENRTLRYAGAGHPPLLFGSLNGKRQPEYREIEANGLMLGISEDAAYSSVELAFQPGDRCVLYTDGVVEAKNAVEEEFGAPRFREFLELQAGLAAGALIEASVGEVERWSGRGDGARSDDITLIAVQFTSD